MVSVRKVTGLVAAVALAAVVVAGCDGDNNPGDGHTHSWGNWSVTTPATCDAPGLEIRYCALDNSHTETKTIAQLPGSSCAAVSTFTDSRDGQTYRAVTIGTQTWMAENLNYDAGDGSVCYDSLASNCDTYGRLYNWATVMGFESKCNSSTCANQVQNPHQGKCPAGWHVPSDAEWTTLTGFVGGLTAGTKLKSTSGWNNRDDGGSGNGTDEFGFSALPGGAGTGGLVIGDFGFAGNLGYWLSATEDDTSSAWNRNMSYNNNIVPMFRHGKILLQSVRCVRDSAAPQ